MYTTANLITDITEMITNNAAPFFAVAILLASVRFIISWFFGALGILTDAGGSR